MDDLGKKIENDRTYYRGVVRKGFFEELTSEEPMENEGASHKRHVLGEKHPNQIKSGVNVPEMTILLHLRNHKRTTDAAVKLF